MLENLKYTCCPCCQAAIRKMVKESLHCNGHWNETMEFECGCEYHWSPNFMREELKRPCPRAHALLLKTRELAKNPKEKA